MSRAPVAMMQGALVALLLAAGGAGAQAPGPAPSAAPTAAPAAAPAVDLEAAYRKEYAFLAAQKRELQERLQQGRAAFERDHAALEQRVATLEGALLAAGAEAESLAAELAVQDQAAAADAEQRDLVTATIEQATTTLASFDASTGIAPATTTATAADAADAATGAAPTAVDEGQRLQAVFADAQRILTSLGQLRRSEGSFYLADGSEATGTLLHWGNVAAYGVSEAGSGALVPAGGGRFRLWNQPSGAAAGALVRGEWPQPLPVFLYENANTAIAPPAPASLYDEVAKGGLIGWIIVALGVVALLLAVLRSVFLRRAGSSISHILDGVAPHVRGGRIDEAIAACKRSKGSAARVVTAALRNLDRDREHLEDIVSESILHESTHLNRFGAMITVLAAVAPLLGLLGTVTGMIQTFDVITEFGTSDPKLLSGGIAVALVTTELGLAVAIPAILAGALLNAWAERIKDGMEGAALRVINLFHDVRGTAVARSAVAA